jgi:hypothetical protein
MEIRITSVVSIDRINEILGLNGMDATIRTIISTLTINTEGISENDTIMDRVESTFENLGISDKYKKNIDLTFNELQRLTENQIFVEYYIHTGCMMFKIINEYTEYKEDKVCLCSISEGYEKALKLAIKYITEAKSQMEIQKNLYRSI